MIEMLRDWLSTCPELTGVSEIDRLERGAIGCALYPMGLQEIHRREDICGGTEVVLRGTYLLRLSMEPGQAGAQRLLKIQQWVRVQDAQGTVPQFGTRTRIQAGKGRLESADGFLGVYRMELTVEYAEENDSKENA